MAQASGHGKPSASEKREGRISLFVGVFAFDYFGPPDFMHTDSQAQQAAVEAGQKFTTALQECVIAVSEAHEQIESNRGEIERLGEETRRLLSELKAA